MSFNIFETDIKTHITATQYGLNMPTILLKTLLTNHSKKSLIDTSGLIREAEARTRP